MGIYLVLHNDVTVMYYIQPPAEQQSTPQPVVVDPALEKKYRENFQTIVSHGVLVYIQHCMVFPCMQVYEILVDTVDKMILEQT